MYLRVSWVVYLLFAIGLQVNSQTVSNDGIPVYDGPAPRAFFKTWLMTDPINVDVIKNATDLVDNIPRDQNRISFKAFDLDFLQDQGGETSVRPTSGSRVMIAGVSSVWRIQEAKTDRIDFDDLFGRHEYVIVYAYAEVNVEEATEMIMGIGSDDQCKIWLNGEKVYSFYNGRSNNVDDDYVLVNLNEGKNSLLFKVMNQQMQWGMTCRFLRKSDISEMELLEMQLDSLPQDSFNELAVIVGGVVLTSFLLLSLLLFLAKSNRKF